MAEVQEGNKTPEAQQEEEEKFIAKFSKLNSIEIIRGFENNNRDKILESSFAVRGAFDQQWKKIAGNYYFQPVTTISAVAEDHRKRIDPKSNNYRVNTTFSNILWSKVRRKVGGGPNARPKNLYTIKGVVKNGNERPIFQNLEDNRLIEVLGEKDARKILADKANNGEVEGPFSILVEGYWEVRFQPMRDQNDQVDVPLSWEGQTLLIKRMAPVVLPGFYLEIADNAMEPKYIHAEGQGRKIVGWVSQYPYTTLREATMEEYIAMKNVGDKIMRDHIRRLEGR